MRVRIPPRVCGLPAGAASRAASTSPRTEGVHRRDRHAPVRRRLRSLRPPRAMPELTVYEKPTCTTCRKLAALLEERDIDFERVNYHVDPLPEAKIRELLA